MDQDASQSPTNGTDEWGADSNEQSAFGSSANDGDGKHFALCSFLLFQLRKIVLLIYRFYCIADGWGSATQTTTWAPTIEKMEDNPSEPTQTNGASAANPVAIKREPASTAMETAAEGDDTAVWFMERVCVQLKSDERTAVIREINSDKTAVVELEDGATQTVRVDDVSRILPKEKDLVLVIGGADVGVEGELVCIDGSDAILKDPNEDFKIVDFVHLAKIAADS